MLDCTTNTYRNLGGMSMKRKKILSFIMTMLVALSTVTGPTVWADETGVTTEDIENDVVVETEEQDIVGDKEDAEEKVQDDSEQNLNRSETDFSDEIELTNENVTKEEDFTDATGVYASNEQYYELNKPIKMKDIPYHSEWARPFYLKIYIPENGRIKVRGSDLSQVDDVVWGSSTVSLYGETNNLCNRRIKKSLDSFECNYITVKPGEYEVAIEVKSESAINDEARLIIEYQTLSEYVGETEDNDTYDTATALQNGVMCEGDYSAKDYDVDVYCFNMEKPGRAEIVCDNSNNNWGNRVSYKLYEEDQNENVYQISDLSNGGYWRLPAGKYYIKMNFEGGEYIDDWAYGIKWTATYESENDYEVEKNNIQSTANIKQVNQWYMGNINDSYQDSKDIDWFRFDIAKKSYIYVEMKTKREARENLLSMSLFKGTQLMDMEYNTGNPYLKTKTFLVEPGTYYIRMMNDKYSDASIDWDYSVRLNQKDYIDVERINMLTNMKLKAGQKAKLSAVVLPENASEKAVQWKSNNTEIVSVDKSGNIIAKKEGKAKVTVSSAVRPDIKAVCEITVWTDKAVPTQKPSTTVKLKKQVIKTLKSPKAGRAYVKWNKDNNATGYQIQYSVNSKIKTGIGKVSIQNKNITTKTITKLKKRKKYYFRVRSYSKKGGKIVYGQWSTIKSVRIK